MRILNLTVAVGLVLGLLSQTQAGAAVLLSENFDELTPTLDQTSEGAFSTIGGTNVDVVGDLHGNSFASLCSGLASGNCVDMDGTGGNPIGILRSNTQFTLLPGVSYDLSFDLVGNQRTSSPALSSVTVTLGSYSRTISLAEFASDSVNSVFQVTSLTNDYLTFASNDPAGDQEGLLLDNVLLTSDTSSDIPEPASLSLLAVGLPLLSALRRRRQ